MGSACRVPEGLGDALGSECLTSSQVMLTLAQGPHCENNDSKVTENLAPWPLEEMTGELEPSVRPRALIPFIPTETRRQTYISDRSVTIHGAENTAVNTGVTACRSSRASQHDVFMGFHCL